MVYNQVNHLNLILRKMQTLQKYHFYLGTYPKLKSARRHQQNDRQITMKVFSIRVAAVAEVDF